MSENNEFDWATFWLRVRNALINKYILTLLIFGALIGFLGEHSLMSYTKRRNELRHVEKQHEAYQENLKQTQAQIDMLQSTDSLERFAREHYYMHAGNEDVYLIDE